MSEPRGELRGDVEDINGNRLEGAKLTLTAENHDAPDRTAVTPANGEFTFVLLELGNYRLEASKEGFVSMEFPSVHVREGDPFIITIAMTPDAE